MGIAIALAFLDCSVAGAQMGPVDSSGYIEYRFDHLNASEYAANSAHGAALRIDLSTFFWRPWIVSARTNLLISEYASDVSDGLARSTTLQGGLWLNILGRSKVPMTLFYEDFDADYDSEPFRRFARTQNYGFRQQVSSRRFGTYSLEWRKGYTNALYADGVSVPNRNDNEKLEFSARKSLGRNSFHLASRNLTVDGRLPELHTDSLRHTLRHSYKGGARFNVQNTFFVTDERVDSQFFSSDREFKQLYSIATWRPNTEKRLLVTGRGLFQDSVSAGQAAGSGQSSVSLSGTASYQVSERVSLSGALGFSTMENEIAGTGDTTYEQVGVSYRSKSHPFLGGTYRYDARTTFGNRNESGMPDAADIRELKVDLGHVLGRSFIMQNGKRLDVRGLQRISTAGDSTGREYNILRSSIYLTKSEQTGQVSRYLRFSVTDQRTSGDEARVFQLADVQYSLQGNISRERSWNLNASVQYGKRSQDKPIEATNEGASLSYSVSLLYRHTDLFDVQRLNLTSDFRFQSDDFESEDPFDPEFDINRQRLNANWRNRLDYRIGLLELQGDVDVSETDGNWSTTFRLRARRNFG